MKNKKNKKCRERVTIIGRKLFFTTVKEKFVCLICGKTVATAKTEKACESSSPLYDSVPSSSRCSKRLETPGLYHHVSWHHIPTFQEGLIPGETSSSPTKPTSGRSACSHNNTSLAPPALTCVTITRNRKHLGEWTEMFQGLFPDGDTAEDGYHGVSPVTAFPAQNNYGTSSTHPCQCHYCWRNVPSVALPSPS